MPDLGPNCLKGLSADDNVKRFNAKIKYIGQLQLVITLKVSNSLDPIRPEQNVGLIWVQTVRKVYQQMICCMNSLNCVAACITRK